VKVTISEIYSCELDDLAESIVGTFPRMVEWWIGKAERIMEGGLRRPVRYSEFRDMHYHEWRREFTDWNTHYAQTSSLVAYTETRLRFPSYVRKGLRVKANFAVIHPNIVAVRNGCLRISTKPRLYSYVKLNPRDRRQSLLLEQAEKGVWRIGQVLLTGEWALIPLLKEAELLEAIDPVLSDIARAF